MSSNRAVVIGGSVAGLAAASTLAGRMDEVLVVERHEASPQRPSTSGQGHLPHVLLTAGLRVLEQLHPGFARELIERGAVTGASRTTVPCHWVAAGTLRDHLKLPDLGFDRAMCSRTLVESVLRRRTLELSNVRLVQGTVDGLLVDKSARRITGVRNRGGEQVRGDLVVDASGRSTGIDDWLRVDSLPVPTRTEVGVDLRYTAFLVPRVARDFGGATFAVVQNTPAVPRIGVALPHEDGLWQIVLGGYFGEAAPVDRAGARSFAQSLVSPVLADIVSRPTVQEPARYTFRSSLRRHWEHLSHPVDGLSVVGDAVASFNPLYGQGMSSAMLQAEALGAAIDRHGLGIGLAKVVARATSRVVDNPWTIATGADFVYPAAVGQRPPGHAFINRYIDRVTRAASRDEHVNRAFTEVQQLLAAPPTLFHPSVVARALRAGRPAAADDDSLRVSLPA